jgi:hypothetical protein
MFQLSDEITAAGFRLAFSRERSMGEYISGRANAELGTPAFPKETGGLLGLLLKYRYSVVGPCHGKALS